MEVSVRELSDHWSEYLRRSAASDGVVVTSNAKPVARLWALPAPAQTEDEAIAGLRDQPWVRPAEDKGGCACRGRR